MAAATRKKASRRKGATRGKSSHGWKWFLSGLVLGFASAALLYFKGYVPGRPGPQPVAAGVQQAAELEPAAESGEIAAERAVRRYDFFTVLPEMEVVVPDQELSRDVSPDISGEAARYLLQVGSFRNPDDAEQMKARLALLGNVAAVQVVTVNGETWHRVRIGPVEGARRADEVRRSLQDNGIETLILRDSP
ncbi:MAG: SPOR domain-containing protein [Gammaproteobacteria bacterium]|nr:SPOR domain-containing protein [Gammaproteobacteria bacterium]NNE06543.1 hypothetical protein [Xanthomonadales bacterium]